MNNFFGTHKNPLTVFTGVDTGRRHLIALMPLTLGIGTGAQMHQPLAIAVIGGFVMALPLLLIVLPTGIRMIYKYKTITLKIHKFEK